MSGFDIGGPGGPGGLGEALQRAKLLGDDRIRSEPAKETKTDFGSALSDALAEVDRLGDEVTERSAELARGEPVEVHDLMIAMGKSEVAFNLMLEIRNKLVEAWQTLSRSVV